MVKNKQIYYAVIPQRYIDYAEVRLSRGMHFLS
jgi:hypothetical protein